MGCIAWHSIAKHSRGARFRHDIPTGSWNTKDVHWELLQLCVVAEIDNKAFALPSLLHLTPSSFLP